MQIVWMIGSNSQLINFLSPSIKYSCCVFYLKTRCQVYLKRINFFSAMRQDLDDSDVVDPPNSILWSVKAIIQILLTPIFGPQSSQNFLFKQFPFYVKLYQFFSSCMQRKPASRIKEKYFLWKKYIMEVLCSIFGLDHFLG